MVMVFVTVVGAALALSVASTVTVALIDLPFFSRLAAAGRGSTLTALVLPDAITAWAVPITLLPWSTSTRTRQRTAPRQPTRNGTYPSAPSLVALPFSEIVGPTGDVAGRFICPRQPVGPAVSNESR